MNGLVCYLINLDRSPERLQTMDARLKRLGIDYRRITAVDGQTVEFTSRECNARKYCLAHGRLRVEPTEIACYASHVKALASFSRFPSASHALILEDDITFAPDFPDMLQCLLAASDFWDVVKLTGVHGGGKWKALHLSPGYFLVANFFHQAGAAAYLVNHRAATAYMEKMLPMFVPYDHEFTKYWKYGLRGFSVSPFPVATEDGVPSTIDYMSARKKSWWRKGPALAYRGYVAVRQFLHAFAVAMPASAAMAANDAAEAQRDCALSGISTAIRGIFFACIIAAPLWKPAYAVFGCAIALMAALLLGSRQRRKLDFPEKCLLASFLAYPVSALPLLALDYGHTLRGMDTPSRFLAFGFVFYVMASRRVTVKISGLLFALSLGAVFAAFLAFYQFFARQAERTCGGVGITQFAEILGLSCVLCLLGFLGYCGKKIFSALMLCGASCAAAVILFWAQSRMSWISAAVAGTAGVKLLWPFLRGSRTHRLRCGIAAAALILFGALMFSIPATRKIIASRAADAFSDMRSYTVAADNRTSVGIRLDLWRISWRHFKESPIIGIGYGRRGAFNEKLVEENYIKDTLLDFATMHNELLTAVSARGLLGASAIAALYAAPLSLFLRRRKSAQNARQALPSVLGISLVVYYGIAGLTGEPLYIGVTSAYLAFLLIALTLSSTESDAGPYLSCVEADVDLVRSGRKNGDVHPVAAPIHPVIVVCMKWGVKFGPEYVNVLAAMVRRNMQRPHRFVCFTDSTNGLDKEIETRALPEVSLPPGLPERGWKKLGIFSETMPDMEGVALFLDLDLAIMDSLEPFFEHPGEFPIIGDWDFPGGGIGNSSVFRFRIGRHADVLENFMRHGDSIRKRYRNEQAYLSHAMREKGVLSFWPESWCRSFKRHCLRPFPLCYCQEPRAPADVKIVVFHGRPFPHEAMAGWTGKMGLRHAKPAEWLADCRRA